MVSSSAGPLNPQRCLDLRLSLHFSDHASTTCAKEQREGETQPGARSNTFPDVISLRVSDSAFGVLTCLFCPYFKRTFNCLRGHADLLLYGKKLRFYRTSGLRTSLGCRGLRSFPSLFVWSCVKHRNCRPRPWQCYQTRLCPPSQRLILPA